MRKSRAPDTELNFDGLTDAITNLAGSLILLVVLLFAMTRSQELGTDERPIADGQIGARVPTGPLLNDIQAARDAVAQMEQRLPRIEARLPELVVEVGTLARKSGNAATNGGTP